MTRNKDKTDKDTAADKKKTTTVDKAGPCCPQEQAPWPQERAFMARPERYRYVRKLIKPDGCVFCRASRLPPSLDTLCIYKSTHSMLVLNKFPYNSGHTLVIPLKHHGSISDLSAEEYLCLSKLLRQAIEATKKIYECQGLNVGMNLGDLAGAGIPDHLHWHVIPRWHGDTNFFPLISETKVVLETLEQSYERFKQQFRT